MIRAKIRAILKASRGETLVEGIVSILVFTILIATVTMTIMVSLRMTSASNRAAEAMQESVNAAMDGTARPDQDFDQRSETIQLQISGTSSTLPPIDVTITEVDGFIAFAPTP
jgi:Tfp pilus assembly protein PilV